MTEQKYKVGDKVLVEAVITDSDIHEISEFNYAIKLRSGGSCYGSMYANTETVHPYTPEQEFKFGDIVNILMGGVGPLMKVLYITSFFNDLSKQNEHVVIFGKDFEPVNTYIVDKCYKIPETGTIGNTTYDKAEFENAVKDLKPVEGE